jgi:O-antigen/teichoic acid export membrane protein
MLRKAAAALATPDKRASMIRRLASFADQGMQGAAGVAVNILLARSMAKADFASIGLMLGIYYFTLGFHRANVVMPFILDGREAGEAGAALRNRWWAFNLAFVAATALCLAVAAAGAALLAHSRPDLGWMARGLFFAVFVSPAMLMTEFMRRWLYQEGRAMAAATASLVFCVLNVGFAAMAYRIDPAMGAWSWVVASAGFVGIALVVLPPRLDFRSHGSVWRRHRQFSLWQSASHIPYTLYNNSVVLLMSAFGGAVAASSFAVGRTLTSPLASVVAAVDLLDKPRAVRALASDGVKGLKSSIGRTRRLLVAVNGAYLLVLLLETPRILHLAFGSRYDGHELDVRLLASAFFLISLNQPSETMLIALKDNKLLFASRIAAAVSAVAAIGVGGKLFGPTGCFAALLGVQLFNLVLLQTAERVAAARAKRDLA